MLTDNDSFYLVNLRDVQKVVKKDKAYVKAGYTPEFVQSLLMAKNTDISDDKGVLYWQLDYNENYSATVMEFLMAD